MSYYDISLVRKQEIEEVLMEIMLEIPYEQITVKSITDRTQIARKTFYHYFSNKHSCLESLIDRLVQESNLQLIKLPENSNRYDECRERLSFWIRNKAFLDIIISNHLASLFIQRILLYIHREDLVLLDQLSTADVICDEDILFYYIAGQTHLILKWCTEGFPLPLEEMVRKMLRLVHMPLLPTEEYKET